MKPAGDEPQALSAVLADVADQLHQLLSDENPAPSPDQPATVASLLEKLKRLSVQLLEWERGEQERHWQKRMARRVQIASLPDAAPDLPGFKMGGATFQADEVGGDYLDFLTLADGSQGIAIGDAMGHGIGAALIISQVCAYLRALVLAERAVGRIVALANRRVERDVPQGYFVTLLLAQLNPATGALAYASAGHPTGYLLDSRGNVRRTLPSTGPPLAVAVTTRGDFPTGAPVIIEPGELMLFLTDGILEATGPEHGQFGIERVLDVVRTSRKEHPDAIVKALVAQVRAHAMGKPDDDMTAIVLKADSSY